MSNAKVMKPTDINVPASSLWAKLPIIGAVLGLGGLGVTLASASGEHGARAMFSYLFAFEVVLCIVLGGVGWVMIEHAVRSQWSPVVRRIGETVMATVPLFAILFVPIATLGFHALYPWTHETDEVLETKRWFLTPGFFFLRAGIYLVVWTVLSVYFYRKSVAQDGLGNNLAERDRISLSLRKASVVGILFWALTLSFQAIDWVMSTMPHWYSTIFGVYFFAASILSFYAFTTLVAMGLQKSGMLKNAITTEHYHDLGKYVFGFTVFWAYIAFSQFILIWYANIPEETEFYLTRVHGGWAPISYALPVVHFFVPFLFLMSRYVKRNRVALAAACVWTLVMHCVDMYWIIIPNFGGHGESHFAPALTDVTALVGVFGLFLMAFGLFLRKNAVICINEPRLEDSLAHENY